MVHTEYANTAPQNQGNIIHKVLVVDDVKAIAMKLQAALPADRFQVVSAARIREALQLLGKEPLPTVIVLDIYLPLDSKLRGGVQLASFRCETPQVGRLSPRLDRTLKT